MKRVHRVATISVTAAAIAILCTSCPVPLDQDMVVHVKDEIVPSIQITSPNEGSFCANVVEIVGLAVDLATADGAAGQIGSLAFDIPGSAINGSADVAEDGSFAIQFSTVTLPLSFTVVLTAEDWNGNTSTTTIVLHRDPENQIPSLLITPGNKTVNLQWDEVPNTVSYSVYYTKNGSLPSEQNGEMVSVTNPSAWVSDLVNGKTHVFQIKSVPEPGWDESVSEFVEVIPLSDQTLAPEVSGGANQIQVRWNEIDADQYEVWRSTTKGGTYFNLSGPIAATEYVDESVADDTWYYYKVRPSLANSALSVANGTTPSPFRFYEPALVHSMPTPALASRLVIDGAYAYVAAYTAGLLVVNISNPLAPYIEGTCDTPGQANSVAFDGSFAYVADAAGGLHVIDVSVKDAPVIVPNGTVASSAFGDDPVNLAVRGDYAYVGAKQAGLVVVDISARPPTVEGSVVIYRPDAVVASAAPVAVVDDYAYVGGLGNHLHVIDISDPTNPTKAGEWAETAPTVHHTFGITVVGDVLDAANGTVGLRVLDITNRTAPTSLGSVDTIGHASGVVVRGDHAFLADYSSGMQIIDVSDPTDPIIVAGEDTPGDNRSLGLAGNYVFVADNDAGIQVIDIASPENALHVGTYDSGWEAFGVDYDQSYAYVAQDIAGLVRVNVSDPLLPVSAGGSNSSKPGLSVEISGEHAYVAAYSKLAVIDISGSPFQRGSVTTPHKAWRVDVSGDYAYVADRESGIQIVDISSPSGPTIVGDHDTPGQAFGVAVKGDYAYVADRWEGVQIFDVSDRTSPSLIGAYGGIDAWEIEIRGNRAFVAAASLVILDISVPDAPTLVATVPMSHAAYSLDVVGDYVFLADGTAGLTIVDIRPLGFAIPRLPRVTTIPALGWASSVRVAGSYAYVTSGYPHDAAPPAMDWGMAVVDLLP